jgi:hypothetical protein
MTEEKKRKTISNEKMLDLMSRDTMVLKSVFIDEDDN